MIDAYWISVAAVEEAKLYYLPKFLIYFESTGSIPFGEYRTGLYEISVVEGTFLIGSLGYY